MRRGFLVGLTIGVGFALAGLFGVARAEEIGSVNTTWRALGASDKIVVEAFDDPAVPGVACHLSRAKTGGLAGSVGWAEDKADASVACRQVGPITVELSTLKKRDGEQVFNQRTSLLFKTMQVVRFIDVKRNTIVYMVYSDHLIEGSPKNAISTVSPQVWVAAGQ